MASQYQGVDADLRNLWRRGSGLTPRRLLVLIRGLRPDALLWLEMDAAQEKAEKPTPEQIRERKAHYDRLKLLAEEETDG